MVGGLDYRTAGSPEHLSAGSSNSLLKHIDQCSCLIQKESRLPPGPVCYQLQQATAGKGVAALVEQV